MHATDQSQCVKQLRMQCIIKRVILLAWICGLRMFFFPTDSEKERKNSEDVLTIPDSELIAGINSYTFKKSLEIGEKVKDITAYLELGDCYELSDTRNKTNIIKAIEYLEKALDFAKERLDKEPEIDA